MNCRCAAAVSRGRLALVTATRQRTQGDATTRRPERFEPLLRLQSVPARVTLAGFMGVVARSARHPFSLCLLAFICGRKEMDRVAQPRGIPPALMPCLSLEFGAPEAFRPEFTLVSALVAMTSSTRKARGRLNGRSTLFVSFCFMNIQRARVKFRKSALFQVVRNE